MTDRMRVVGRFFWVTCVLLAACDARPALPGARLAVAANVKPVMDALEARFEADTFYEIEIVTGATGALYTQIINGAPFDILLAADQARPEKLESDGQGIAGTRFTYATGRLALWSAAPGTDAFKTLSSPNLRTLAHANPDLAPYGRAAEQVIAALGLEAQVADKRVLGQNVGQAFAFVQTGNAELGFVALSQVLSLPARARGLYWVPPDTLYTPIKQDAILLAHGERNEAALAFLTFLQGQDARDMIAGAGYKVP